MNFDCAKRLEKRFSTATPDYNSVEGSTLEHSHDCRGSTTSSSKTETAVEKVIDEANRVLDGNEVDVHSERERPTT
jgi:hypothetical protein